MVDCRCRPPSCCWELAPNSDWHLLVALSLSAGIKFDCGTSCRRRDHPRRTCSNAANCRAGRNRKRPRTSAPMERLGRPVSPARSASFIGRYWISAPKTSLPRIAPPCARSSRPWSYLHARRQRPRPRRFHRCPTPMAAAVRRALQPRAGREGAEVTSDFRPGTPGRATQTAHQLAAPVRDARLPTEDLIAGRRSSQP